MKIGSQQTAQTVGYAEPKERAPKIAILDDFDGDQAGFPHGQAVESVLLSHSSLGDADIQRLQNTPKQADLNEILKGGKVGFREAFGSMVVRNVAGFYLSTAQNLHTILQEQPTVKVIGQSQGETAGRQLEESVFSVLRTNEGVRHQVAQSLGLESEAPLPELCEKLLQQADTLISQNELCQKARKEYEKAAKAVYDKGITYLVAAGNHGDFAGELQQMGVKASNSAFRSIFANEFVTVVGANDAKGQPSTLNSPGSAIEVYELGEDLPWQAEEGFDKSGVNSGTSFAVPILAGKVLQMLEKDPSLTPFEIESTLEGLDSYKVSDGNVVATSNGQSLVGDGLIEPYILDRIGEGFVKDIYGDEARQFAEATLDTNFFGLPGAKDHEFQFVRIAPDPGGVRQLTVQTYFNEGHHQLRASLKDGAWDPASVSEELHLDAERQKGIEAAQS